MEFGITFIPPPKTVGYYLVGDNLSFHLVRRPHWLARLMARWLLDWKWFDGQWEQR